MADLPSKSFSKKSRFGISFNVVLTVLAMLAVVTMVNYLASRYFYRFQLADESRVELSPMTKGMLRNLNTNINIHFFFRSDHELYSHVDSLLKEYSLQTPFIHLRSVDNILNKSASAELITRFKLDEENVVIFECGGRVQKILAPQLGDFALAPSEEPGKYYRKMISFKGESLFTGAILSMQETTPLKVYFLQGHGELNFQGEGGTGYKRFAEIVRENNAELAALDLKGVAIVPPDCKLLVIAGTSQELPKMELDKISNYLEEGGRAFILFDARRFNMPTGLELILARWKLNVGQNVVTEGDNQSILEAMPFSKMEGIDGNSQNEGHPIVNPLAGYSITMVQPRTIGTLHSGKSEADAAKATPLLVSGSKSRWLDYANPKTGNAQPTEKDNIGAAVLAAAVERGVIRGVSAERSATRMIVTGDSYFLNNDLITEAANADFARLSLGWLMDRSAVMSGVGPRPVKEYRITLTARQVRKMRWILVAVIPGSILALGGIVWFMRRN